MSRASFGVSLLVGGPALCIAAAVVGLSMQAGPTAPDPDLRIDGRGYQAVDLQVNTFTASDQDSVTLDRGPDGRFVVAWQSRRQQAGTYGCYARTFDRLGAPRGGEARVNATVVAHQRAPAVAVAASADSAAAADGGSTAIWAAWQSFGQDGSGEGCFARRLDADADAGIDGDEIAVTTTTAGDQTAITCVARPDGSVTFGWLGPRDGSGPVKAHLRAMRADGTFRTGEVLLDRDGEDRAQVLALAAYDDGVVVAWSAVDASGAARGILVQRLSANLVPLDAPLQVDAGEAAANGIEPKLAAAPDGRFAVAWLERATAASTGGYDVWVRSYAPDGSAGEAHRVRAAGDDWLSGASVAITPGGDVVAAWNRERLVADGSVIEARRFDAHRDAWGELFRPTASEHARLDIADGRRCVAFDADGRMAFAWSGDSGSGDAKAAHLTLLSPADLGERLCEPTPIEPQTPAFVAAGGTVETAHLSEATPHDPPTYTKPTGPIVPPEPAGVAGPDFGFGAVNNTGWTPPDPHVAAGPNHVMIMTNGAVAAYTKSGTQTFVDDISGGTGGGQGFWGALGATNFVFDPEVIWDPFAGRFVVMACERNPSSGSGSSFFLFAYSDDADPNGTWHKYRVDVTALGDIGSGGGDIDSPNIMVDQNVLYLSADFFRGGQHHLIYMLDKAPLLNGSPVGTTNSLVINTTTNSFGHPVIHGNSPVAYMIGHSEGGANNTVRLYAIQNPLTNPSVVTFDLGVPTYSAPLRVPQRGTATLITTFDARFWSCVWRSGSLWATHHEGSTGRTLQRWYEIATNGWPISRALPSLRQSGSIDNGPGVHTFFGSINADNTGNAVMCYAQSSTGEFISIGRSYRLASDPAGSFRPRQIIRTNTLPYTRFGRWGDYSEVSEDPAAANTFWYGHEYATQSNQWTTWIGRVTTNDWLSADRSSVSVAAGGTVNFEFENSAEAGNGYLLLGSLSGQAPPTILNPGGVSLPIVFDGFTLGILGGLNTPIFSNFINLLDGDGVGDMQLVVVPGVTPLLGRTMTFALATFDTSVWRFASNPVTIVMTP